MSAGRVSLLALVTLLLAACASSPPRTTNSQPTPLPPTAMSGATATPSTTPPTPIAANLAPTTIDGVTIPQGRTPEGYWYLGNANAPITLVMYSDFF